MITCRLVSVEFCSGLLVTFHLPVEVLLTDVGWSNVGEYLASMAPPIISRHQWGGFVEAVIMGRDFQMQVAFFIELRGGDMEMMTAPAGTGTKGSSLTQTLLSFGATLTQVA